MEDAIMIVYNNSVGRGMLAWMEALEDKGVEDGGGLHWVTCHTVV